MLTVYQPAVPIRAAIVTVDLTDAPGQIDAEELVVCGVQAVAITRKDRHPAVRHELLVWCEEFQTPRSVLDVFDDRREALPGHRVELVVTPCPNGDATAHQAAVGREKARLHREFEEQAARQPVG